jgi:hypothetical protein
VTLAQADERFIRQKYRVQWLNLRDKNSKFSFNSIKYHHCRKKILSIHNDIDTFITEQKGYMTPLLTTLRIFWGVSVKFWY